MADDMGYGDLGCYGQEVIQTPNIDTLAQEGMRFTQFYAGSTVCAPSRSCLMTGLHTGHTRIRGNERFPLRPEDTTVAETLKQAGYTTGVIGKWGLGEPETTGVPNKQGFDYFFGYLNQRHAHNYYPAYLWRNETQVPLKNEVTPVNPPGGVATKRVEYSHDLFTQEALSFVEAHQNERFFLYLSLTIPHANNENRPDGMEVPSYGVYADKDWPDQQKAYAAMITRLDGDLGRVLQKLKDLGLDNNTIIFFTSDNGPHQEGGADPTFFHSSGPLRGFKRSLHEGGIRVPFIVRWPGRIKAGTQSDHVGAFWDMMPTFADLAGITAPTGIDGISIVPTLLGRVRQQKEHKFLYWEFHENGSKQAVRMGDWKAIRVGPDGPLQLYNLNKDIAETQDVADQYPDVVETIEAYLTTARTESEIWKLKS
jgi:arylsulfatase A-like enzyme